MFKSLSNFNRKTLLLFFVFFFGFYVNWYSGFQSFAPPDSFAVYHSGLMILKGNVPYKDYWSTQGTLLDVSQFIFFKLGGVSWKSYIIHSSMINGLFACFLFYFFDKFEVNKTLNLIISLTTVLICYPQIGVPNDVHHSIIFSIMALLTFLLALKFDSKIHWFLIPIFIFLGFLSKQTPSGYFFLIILFFLFLDLAFDKKIKKIFVMSLSSIICLLIFFLMLGYNDIEFKNFYNQYINFPLNVGEVRANSDAFLRPFNFSRYFVKFKYMHLSYFCLVIILINHFLLNKRKLNIKDLLSILAVISSTYALIIHQLLSMSIKHIYFYIPILLGVSHIFIIRSDLTKKHLYRFFTIFIFILSVPYYFYTYIYNQKFKLACYKKNLTNYSITKIVDNKNNVKWKTCLYTDPSEEIEHVKNVELFLKNEIKNKDNYILISDYYFLDGKLSANNKSLSKWYHPGVHFPEPNYAEFNYFKEFLKKKLEEEEIKFIIFVYPSLYNTANEKSFKIILNNCSSEVNSVHNNNIKLLNVEKCY